MAKPRDVIFYVPSASPLLATEVSAGGGAETQVLMLASELARRGHAVGIVAFGDGADLRRRVGGVDVIEHPRPSVELPLLRTLAFYWHALSTLRANRARVLVQRAAGAHTVLVALAAPMLRCRFVYASAGVHDFDLRRWDGRGVIAWLFAFAAKRADTIVVQTEEQAQLCRARLGRVPRVIKSIAEPAAIQRSPPQAFLWIGSTIAYKQPMAFVALARALPEAQFWMIAVPTATSEGLELSDALAHAAAITPNLELLPARPRAGVAAVIDHSVAIVSTSRTEGMPNVFLEGWSRGVPALALTHDPDGVLERERLGDCAGGSIERLIGLAQGRWRTRDDRGEEAARCRAYAAREHSLEQIAELWLKALAL